MNVGGLGRAGGQHQCGTCRMGDDPKTSVADPSYTCAQCHEVKDSHARWGLSAHKDVACVECHAAALENGVEGLAEKLGMMFAHFSKDVKNSDIKMTEKQV